MKKIAICFTENGIDVIKRINAACESKGLKPLEAHISMAAYQGEVDGFFKVEKSLFEWTGKHFQTGNALIFVGAMGIAVRAIAEYVKDKLVDCPVVVIDDNAQFVIPVLSGHVGGANKLAVILAEMLGAVPVITTATDVNDVFAVDQYAVEKNLTIADRQGIKKVSAKALEGRKITLSIKDYPPKEKVDVVIADETDAECSLLLKPKKYTVGLGMKKGKDPFELETFFLEILKDNNIATEDIYALCTIDIKEDEDAVISLRDKYRIPVLSFDRELLNKATGEFTASEFVRQNVGVDNVCERAASLGAGDSGEIIVKKTARDGMTIAIARRNAVVDGNI